MKLLISSLVVLSALSINAQAKSPKVQGDVCRVSPTGEIVQGAGGGGSFFNLASNYAQRNHVCVFARIYTVPNSGRLYEAGTGRKLADKMSIAEGMGRGCVKFTCDEYDVVRTPDIDIVIPSRPLPSSGQGGW